jgi:hypothetical protein
LEIASREDYRMYHYITMELKNYPRTGLLVDFEKENPLFEAKIYGWYSGKVIYTSGSQPTIQEALQKLDDLIAEKEYGIHFS